MVILAVGVLQRSINVVCGTCNTIILGHANCTHPTKNNIYYNIVFADNLISFGCYSTVACSCSQIRMLNNTQICVKGDQIDFRQVCFIVSLVP